MFSHVLYIFSKGFLRYFCANFPVNFQEKSYIINKNVWQIA